MAKLLTANQVCNEVGISIFTLNNWYRYKRENPNDDLARILPDYTKEFTTSPRQWRRADIKKLLKFKQTRNLGSKGQMAKTIQKYYKKEKQNEKLRSISN